MFRAFSDRTRLRMVWLLLGKEFCVAKANKHRFILLKSAQSGCCPVETAAPRGEDI